MKKDDSFKSYILTNYVFSQHPLDGSGMAKTIDMMQKFFSLDVVKVGQNV